MSALNARDGELSGEMRENELRGVPDHVEMHDVAPTDERSDLASERPVHGRESARRLQDHDAGGAGFSGKPSRGNVFGVACGDGHISPGTGLTARHVQYSADYPSVFQPKRFEVVKGSHGLKLPSAGGP